MVVAQPRIRLGKGDARISLGFCDINGSSNLGQKKKGGLCHPSEKTDKYQDLAKELKKNYGG